ncbi:MAG TPA: hypothetical protein V6C58_13325 [Allocoleopsis sp.]
MNQQNQEWQQRLEDLETEINQNSSIPKIEIHPVQPISSKEKGAEFISSLWIKVKNWYDGLASTGKVVVTVGALLIGFSLLNSVLKLIGALISIAVVAVILFVGYKFFIESEEQK